MSAKRAKLGPDAPLPKFVKPQLAKLAAAAPEGDGWVYEPKLDGYRIAARIDGKNIQLLTRTGLDWSSKYPAAVQALSKINAKAAYIDGELCAVDEDGLPNFNLMQNAHVGEANLIYYAFDLLHLNGEDLRPLPLLKRKQLLPPLIARKNGLHFNQHFGGPGADFLAASCKIGLEGVVAKRTTAGYMTNDRSGSWIKVKCTKRQEFIVVGWTDPEGSRVGFGALLLGYYDDDGKLQFAGRVGTGFDDKSLISILKQLKPLAVKKMPLAKLPKITGRGKPLRPATTHWIKPKLVAEVNYMTWDKEGLLRAASYVGIRNDKCPQEVRREA
ncbi:non-homologous end-joining DNA ligase [Methylocella sp. CPCC 101449]|uniref:non-homologous end-joining DNA ligase n=1 Tax=Methylocella sp. CPCC 101449 TaxID=2987531 RepID=UPI00288DF2C7|nr:non-homologous end-joining DNA ligase [Methylocella sp. CPCC 101449]MDT2024541.1 non-homologous end-joining DNA ligase [Methylocella sp. CPCC 101449]